MSTKPLTLTFDPDVELDKLESIVEQVNASKDATREVVMFARMLDKVAERISDEATAMLAAFDVSGPVSELREWALTLAPTASVTWSQDELQRTLAVFSLFEDRLTDAQKSRLAACRPVLTNVRQRAPRGQGNTKTYEDRPARVRIETVEGDKISEQAGNTPMSITGLTNGVVRYLERQKIEVTDEMRDDVKTTIKKVVLDGQDDVVLGDFGIIKIVA